MSILVNAILNVLMMLLNLYSWIVIIAALLSFVNPDPYNPIVRFIYGLTEPVFSFIRKKMPFVVINGIDLSPLIVLIAISILNSILAQLYIY